jgi:hypothetical protein
MEKLLLNVELPGGGQPGAWLRTMCALHNTIVPGAQPQLVCSGVESSKGLKVIIEDKRVLVHLRGRYRLVRALAAMPGCCMRQPARLQVTKRVPPWRRSCPWAWKWRSLP